MASPGQSGITPAPPICCLSCFVAAEGAGAVPLCGPPVGFVSMRLRLGIPCPSPGGWATAATPAARRPVVASRRVPHRVPDNHFPGRRISRRGVWRQARTRAWAHVSYASATARLRSAARALLRGTFGVTAASADGGGRALGGLISCHRVFCTRMRPNLAYARPVRVRAAPRVRSMCLRIRRSRPSAPRRRGSLAWCRSRSCREALFSNGFGGDFSTPCGV